MTDVTLVADGKEMRAHKAILAARSDVFAAMFEHEMQEQKTSRVEITDLHYDVLTEMLRYIYTDCVPNIDKVARYLLVAADKYALKGLMLMCEDDLIKKLSVETVIDTLMLAEALSIPKLKTYAIAFITTNNATRIAETEGWNNMMSTYPHLTAELLSAFIKQSHHLPSYKGSNKNTLGLGGFTFSGGL